jgi:hypothetical protein
MLDAADTLLGKEFGFPVKIRITNPELFADSMQVDEVSDVTDQILLEHMLADPSYKTDQIFERLEVSDVLIDGADMSFKVSGAVKNKKLLSNSAIEFFWGDDTWLPSGMNEAVSELLLASNDNPSPDEMGFEFIEIPGPLWLRPDLVIQIPDVEDESFDLI